MSMEPAAIIAQLGLYAKVSTKERVMQPHENTLIVPLHPPLDTTIVPDNCTHGDIKLVGGNGEHEGTLHICINQVWGTICDGGWSGVDAGVVCQQLGYQRSGNYILVLCNFLNNNSIVVYWNSSESHSCFYVICIGLISNSIVNFFPFTESICVYIDIIRTENFCPYLTA